MIPIVAKARKEAQDEALYKLIVSNLAPIERIAEVYHKTPEEIDEIIRIYSQKDREDQS